MAQQEQGFGTKAIHAGQEPDPVTGAVVTPISLASTFAQSSPGVNKGFEYSRTGNPTRQTLENNIAAIEGGKYGLGFASGSATLQTITSSFVYLFYDLYIPGFRDTH